MFRLPLTPAAALVLTALSIGTLTGCGSAAEGDSSTDVGALGQNQGENRIAVGDADLAEVKRLADVKMYVQNPKLSDRADSVITEDSAFDGTRSITYVVKDADGRLFEVSTVVSDSREGSRVGRHGAPPSFGDTRYFMIMNDKGVDWAIKNFGRKPSTRHAQILEHKNDPSFADSVRDLGQRTIDGKSHTVIHFNSSLFLVADGGFDDACKSEGVKRCADAWQRIDNGEDPFDAR